MHTSTAVFCNNVKKIRIEHKLSKTKMAKILGIGFKSLSAIEKGIIPPRLSADIILKICDEFSLSPKELFI